MTFERTEKLRHLERLQKRCSRKIRILVKDNEDAYRIKRLEYELKYIKNRIFKIINSNKKKHLINE
jgi:hypothetical protein